MTDFEGSVADFKSTINNEANKNKIILVDFHAQWCGPCKMIGPQVVTFANSLGDKLLLLKVDVDECEEVAADCGISAMPTFIVYKGGEKIDTVVGANIEKVKDAVNKASGQNSSLEQQASS